jgi:hypothetical protein
VRRPDFTAQPRTSLIIHQAGEESLLSVGALVQKTADFLAG